MLKLEKEKIQLLPINISQIRLNGQILGTHQNKSLRLTTQQVRCLELMQQEYSISEISEIFVKQGQLISFSQFKILLSFLTSERLISNSSFPGYFEEKNAGRNGPAMAPGFFDQLLGREKPLPHLATRLQEVPFFRSLSPEIVALFLEHHRVIECPAGVKVCEQGRLQRSLLCTLEGSLTVQKMDSAGVVHRIAEISAGSVFGETGFFLNQPRTADVITNLPCLIVKFKYIPEVFDHLIQKEKAQALQKRIWLIHALLSSSMFKQLPDDGFDSLIFAGELKTLKAGNTVFNEGQRGESFFIVVQGTLNVLQNQKVLRTLQQGDCFGEVALLLTGGLRTATISCETEVLLLEISAHSFYKLMGENLLLACAFEKLSMIRVQADQKR